MKVCPKCRHINEDWDQWCSACHYNIASVRPLSMQEHKQKKRNKNILIVIIAAICVTAIILFAAFSSYRSNFYLPEWILERAQFQKTSISVQQTSQQNAETMYRM